MDAVRMASLFAADVMSFVVYGEENRLNLLGDAEQREEFAKDLKWQEERLLKVFSLVMLWYPSMLAR